MPHCVALYYSVMTCGGGPLASPPMHSALGAPPVASPPVASTADAAGASSTGVNAALGVLAAGAVAAASADALVAIAQDECRITNAQPSPTQTTF